MKKFSVWKFFQLGTAVVSIGLLQACSQTGQQSQLVSSTPKQAALKVSSVAPKQSTVVDQQSDLLKRQAAQRAKWQKAWQEQVDRIEAARKKQIKTSKPTKKTVTKKTATPKASAKVSKRSKYDALIRKYANANGIPLKLAHAVVFVESSYRANARGGVGEIGLMQLRLSTARMMGYRGSAKALYNPETNIKYGMKYLGKAYKLGGGSTCGAILKYNAGHGAKRMNPTSAKYCKRVKRLI